MKIIKFILGLVSIIGGIWVGRNWHAKRKSRKNLASLAEEVAILSENGHKFRDLNKNGRLDPYEDSRLPIDERVEDLITQMTLQEKAGLMFHTMISMNKDGSLVEKTGPMSPIATSELIARRHMNHFNLVQAAEPRAMAAWNNRIQKLAERTRLGIPVTISSDPRHAFSNNPATAMMTGAFSQWPEQIGLGATWDADLVQEFGDIARQEYRAVGISVALHPMADLATEPRWCRNNGTFGEDAELSAKLTAAYIHGFQGDKLGSESVACMTKHFPGGGPQLDGEDAHFSYGKEQVYPGENFKTHLLPFEAAFEAGTSQIMPYYGQPIGTDLEEVGFGFNQQVITGLLREKYGFDGIVCTDWMLLTGVKFFGRQIIEAKAWGVEDLSVAQRMQKVIEAGCDQFGGEAIPDELVKLVRDGDILNERIDQSVRRILREKFRLGLFDNPYVDEDAAARMVGNPAFREAGELAQRKSLVLLKNAESSNGLTLPLQRNQKIYVENLSAAIASQYGQVVATPEEADFAILRISAPFEPRKGFLERYFHAGSLAFNAKEKAHILQLCQSVPTILDIYLERPAVIPEVAAACEGLIGNFGADDTAVLDLIFGAFQPTGKLPFELPVSMQAVENQKEDLPYDSEAPLFPFGFGLTYQENTETLKC
jgi:beta-glucosidase